MLAERLGKTRGELRALLSYDEWIVWLAKFEIEAEERAREAARERARAKQKGRG